MFQIQSREFETGSASGKSYDGYAARGSRSRETASSSRETTRGPRSGRRGPRGAEPRETQPHCDAAVRQREPEARPLGLNIEHLGRKNLVTRIRFKFSFKLRV